MSGLPVGGRGHAFEIISTNAFGSGRAFEIISTKICVRFAPTLHTAYSIKAAYSQIGLIWGSPWQVTRALVQMCRLFLIWEAAGRTALKFGTWLGDH